MDEYEQIVQKYKTGSNVTPVTQYKDILKKYKVESITTSEPKLSDLVSQAKEPSLSTALDWNKPQDFQLERPELKGQAGMATETPIQTPPQPKSLPPIKPQWNTGQGQLGLSTDIPKIDLPEGEIHETLTSEKWDKMSVPEKAVTVIGNVPITVFKMFADVAKTVIDPESVDKAQRGFEEWRNNGKDLSKVSPENLEALSSVASIPQFVTLSAIGNKPSGIITSLGKRIEKGKGISNDITDINNAIKRQLNKPITEETNRGLQELYNIKDQIEKGKGMPKGLKVNEMGITDIYKETTALEDLLKSRGQELPPKILNEGNIVTEKELTNQEYLQSLRDLTTESKSVTKTGNLFEQPAPAPTVGKEGITAYHGTNQDFVEFDKSKLGTNNQNKSARDGFWFTDDKNTAQSYAKLANDNIVDKLLKEGKKNEAVKLENTIFANKDKRNLVKVKLNIKNSVTIDAEGKTYNNFRDEINNAITKAKSENKDGIIVKNLSDNADYSEYTPATHYLVFDSKNIKSELPTAGKGAGIPPEKPPAPPIPEAIPPEIPKKLTSQELKAQKGAMVESDTIENISRMEKSIAEIKTIETKALETKLNQANLLKPLPDKSVTRTETKLLISRIKDEVRGSKWGYSAGAKETKQILINKFRQSQVAITELKNDLLQIVKQELPPEVRGQYLTTLSRQNLTREQAWKTLDKIIKRQEVIESADLTSQIKKLSKISGSDTIAADYNKQVSDLLSVYNLQSPSETTLKKLMGLNDYLGANPIVAVEHPELVAKLKKLTTTPIANLSNQQKQVIINDLTQLVRQGKLKFLLKQRALRREVDIIRNDLLSTTVNKDTQNKTIKSFMAFDNNTVPTPFIADKIDGYKGLQGGNVRQIKDLGNTVNLATYKAHQTKLSVLEELSKVKANITEAEEKAIGLHLYLEQKGVLDEKAISLILKENGWTKIPEKTPEMQQIMDIARKYANSNYDDIAKTYLNSKNELLGKVDNYFPVKRIRDNVFREEVVPYRTKQTEHGFVHGRIEGVEDLPRLDFVNVLGEHLDGVSYYINVQPKLDRLSLAINNPAYQKTAGVTNFNFWRDVIDITARHGGYSKALSAPPLLGVARRNLTTAYLGLKASSAFLQPIGMLNNMAFATQLWGAKAAGEVFLETSKSLFLPNYAKKIISESVGLQLRKGGEEVLEEILSKTGGSIFKKGQQLSLKPLQYLDMKTAAGLQSAVKKVLERNGIPNASAQADFFMELISGTNNPVYRPMLLAKGGEWGKAAANLQNFTMTQWGAILHEYIRGGLTQAGYEKKVKALLALGLVIAGGVAEEYTRSTINDFLSGKEEKDQKDIPLGITATMAIPSQVPFFGHMIESVGLKYDPDLAVPITSAIENIGKGTSSIIYGKRPETKLRGAIKAGSEMASFLGIPGTKQGSQIILGQIGIGKPSKQPLTEYEKIMQKYSNPKQNQESAYDRIMKKYR